MTNIPGPQQRGAYSIHWLDFTPPASENRWRSSGLVCHRPTHLPIVRELQAAGVTTLQGLADALNAQGLTTPRGGSWAPVQVRRVLSSASDH